MPLPLTPPPIGGGEKGEGAGNWNLEFGIRNYNKWKT